MTTMLAPSPQMPRHRIIMEDELVPCVRLACRVESDGRTTDCNGFACPSCGSSDVETTGDGGMEPRWFCMTCGGEWAT